MNKLKKTLLVLLGIALGWGLAYKFMPPRDAVRSIPCISAELEMNGVLVTPPGFSSGKWVFCEDEFFKYSIPNGQQI